MVLVSSNFYSVSEYFSSRLAAKLVNDGTVERREFEAIYRLLAGRENCKGPRTIMLSVDVGSTRDLISQK